MSGVFTAGVMDVLMKNNIKFDGTIGVSAGAMSRVNWQRNTEEERNRKS